LVIRENSEGVRPRPVDIRSGNFARHQLSRAAVPAQAIADTLLGN
jgi:hypothetical protein